MRHRHRLIQSLLLRVIPLALSAGCGDGASGPKGGVETAVRVQIEPGPATLVFIGERYQLTATTLDAAGAVVPDAPIAWSSSDSAIVAVGSGGLVTARRDGQANITATTGGVSGRVAIGVDVGQAAARCTTCHGATGAHGPGMFPGATCPTCHLPAFERIAGHIREAPLPGHASLAQGFGLVGVHDTLPCTACHQPPAGAPRFRPANAADCYACHEADYQRRHGGSNFPRTCLLCHTTDGFRGASFNHDSSTARFRLIGIHTTLPCSSCHAPNGTPLFTPRDQNDCVTCHQADYQRRHAGSGYPTTCTGCHTATQWLGATFNHTTATGGRFTLLGSHLTRPCTVCHDATTGAPRFAPRDQNDCVTCHQADYQRRHAGSGYPTTCTGCHTTTQWLGATFNHATATAGRFTLVGSHLTKPCTACHDATTGAPKFIPRDQNDCVTCHQADYQRKHAGSGYPTTCLTCHTTTSFLGAAFNHDANFFRINSGTHRGRWSSCATCHTVPGDFSQFTCFGCHNQSETDADHRGRTGYAHDACSTCHRDV